ncbi:MAG: 2-oxoacid:acceptor oxidoreductase family protein [Candidatus Bathyarchaeota archaeon]|nr:2-oxoacid:acceptor oxidoreductase family protein [Candidatus Bathyarchaeota archaeon]
MLSKTEIRIAGLGGQGVVLAGQILAKAAVYDGKHVVQTQSYGAEARGSAAKSEVIISDDTIRYPKVRQCDILVAMSQPALNQYLNNLKENGVLLVDKDMIKTIPKLKAKIFQVPATSAAETELKRRIYANSVMLGALTKATKIVSQKAIENAIENSVPKEMLKENLRGFRLGLQLIEDK